MPDFPKLPIITPPSSPKFPDLPLLERDPPRLTLREKYGGLLYLGIGGLLFSTFLIGTFFYQLYRTRALWAAVYVLHDPQASEPARLDAAWSIAHDPDANDTLRMDFAMRLDLPELARYIIAEGLTPDAVRGDPKKYVLSAARSDGWPDWLRLLIVRPMAYAAAEGYRIPWEPLDELRHRSDKAIVLWTTYTRAVMGPGDASALGQLRAAAAQPGPYQELAALLVDGTVATGQERVGKLDAATAWLRIHHSPCTQIWAGYEVADDHLQLKPSTQPVPPPTNSNTITGKQPPGP